MIDASKLVAAHLAAQAKAAESDVEAAGDGSTARQYPLAGVSHARPLVDPARRNPESKT